MNAVDATDTCMSGIEMESPHKEISTAKEFPCNIPEVGQVSSSWIGQRGVCDIIELRVKEAADSELQTKSSELRELAIECLQAFESAGLIESENPQVIKATKLCLSYAPRAVTNMHETSRRSTSCAIADLWKQNDPVNNDKDGHPPDAQSLAESLLGDQLVDKVMEKNRQPPDVRYMHYYARNFPASIDMPICTQSVLGIT